MEKVYGQLLTSPQLLAPPQTVPRVVSQDDRMACYITVIRLNKLWTRVGMA
jgi:hypothetical protein